MEWISLKDRKPNGKEKKDNWKFMVANKEDDWVDCAYYEHGVFDNGEVEITPTHFAPLPEPPKEIENE